MGDRGRVRSSGVLALVLAAAAGWLACGSSGDDDDDEADTGDATDDGDDGDDAEARYSQLLRGDPFTRMVIEVDAVAGMDPYGENPAQLADGLDSVVDKPDGVEIAIDGDLESAGADHAWTFDELQALAGDSFDLALADDAIAIHLLFVDGHSADDSDAGVVLGEAWSHTHIAIFKQTIESVCSASVLPEALREQQCRDAELSILIHESGHLLGLVDNDLPMVEPHRDQDAAHGRHDADDGCVMYWAYEGGALFDAIGERLLGGDGGAIGFDDACLADLAAERAR
jgi:hypothetical protein